ncbi:MAG TPA: hypothetical protein VF837_02990 [Patescibacteria group bacterium]
MLPELGIPLSEEDARGIKDEGERAFALACLEADCLVFHQIVVGQSKIDFFVLNPKNPSTEGKLVEVTLESKEDIEKKHIRKGKGRHAKKVINTTGMRKQRQIESMRSSGLPWTILCRNEVENLKRTR